MQLLLQSSVPMPPQFLPRHRQSPPEAAPAASLIPRATRQAVPSDRSYLGTVNQSLIAGQTPSIPQNHEAVRVLKPFGITMLPPQSQRNLFV